MIDAVTGPGPFAVMENDTVPEASVVDPADVEPPVPSKVALVRVMSTPTHESARPVPGNVMVERTVADDVKVVPPPRSPIEA
jgi:hypothetical protein